MRFAFRRLAFRQHGGGAGGEQLCPASVSASRREVRLNSRVPSRASSRLTALETVALESFEFVGGAGEGAQFRDFREDRQAFQIGQIRHVQFWKQ